jgi:uncharacterized protein involved in response to NO
MQTYMVSFVIGFLITSMPRFASAPHATQGEVLGFLSLILGIWAFSSFQQWVFSELCFIGLLILLAFFAARRFMKRRSINSPPLEFVWIPIAILHGIFGTGILISAQLKLIPDRLLGISKLMIDQGFLLCIVMGVGGFLAPRLMGLFKPMGSPEEVPPSQLLQIRRIRIRIHLSLGILFFLSFWIEGLLHKTVGFGLRTIVVTLVLFLNRAWPRPPRARDLYVWLLWISMWMVVSGHWAVILFPRYRVEMLHIVFIGGFSLMTFAVGTMVVMGHAGESEKLRGPLWILWIVLAGLVFALGFRVAAAFFPVKYFKFLGIASVFWLFAAGSWFIFILRKLLIIPDVGEFERFHEAAKKRIQNI